MSKMGVRKQYQLNISNSSEALDSRDDGGRGDILGAWENWC
jgi:hypothetical protein